MIKSVKKLFIITFIFLSAGFSVKAQNEVPVDIHSDFRFAQKILIQNKFSKKFRQDMKTIYEDETFMKVVRLNMLGFLKPTQHGVLITDEAVQKSKDFIAKYPLTFKAAEKKYKVPASVIAALLWIETKHGNLTGHFHVASVYLHLLQVQRKDVLAYLVQAAETSERNQKEPIKNLKKLMRERSQRKALWALDQLKALEKMYKKRKKMVVELTGSFAGAFGIPQYIPSSYLTYARAAKPQAVADLYKPQDAITSVAFYLKKTGWGRTNKQQMKALMHYNNSQDYAESILQLSEKIKSP